MIGTTVSHYRITGTLGSGGMGVVYEAEDERLGRQVAIKFLPDSVTDVGAIERFRREAQAVSSLNHPHICTLHDVGEHQGRPFIVMERMVGKTLKEHMSSGGLVIEEVIRLADQIADGLAAAHNAGIIHRDLKPANIFVTERGDAKLLDFGLVKMGALVAHERTIAERDVTVTGPLTQPGLVMGTASYMSPEQVRGEKVDLRTDIYSLGAVMYEMATGAPAHSGGNDVEILYAVLHQQPSSPSECERVFPNVLENIIVKALEKNPADRFQSAAALRAELEPFVRASTSGMPIDLGSGPKRRPFPRRSVALAAAIVVAVVGLVAGSRFIPRPADEVVIVEGPSRIAVLPFDNLGPSENAYLAEGIAEEVRSKLTGVENLIVIASSSTAQYAGTATPPEQVADELGVRYLLTATVQWQKDDRGDGRVRVTPELVEVSAGGAPEIRWRETIDAPLRDVFQVQTRVATQVSEALNLAFGSSSLDEFTVPPTTDLDAYDAYLRGQQLSSRLGAIDPNSLRDAVLHFERAVALDPDFALAWAQLSRVCTYLFSALEPSPEMRQRAKETGLRAAELAPDHPATRLAVGDYYAIVAGDFVSGLKEYALGLALSPNNPALLAGSAYAEMSLGLWEASVEHFRLAHDLDPRSPLIAARHGFILLLMRRYDQAHEVFSQGLAVAPTNLSMVEQHAMVALAEGDLEEARRILSEPEIERTSLVAYVGTYWGLYWVLDDEQQELLLRLTPSSFGGNRAYWGLILASTARLRGEDELVRKYAGEAEKAFSAMCEANPEDAQLHVLHGLNLAMLGRSDEAVVEGDRSGELLPLSANALFGAFIQHVRVKIHLLIGDHERALDLLEPLLEQPYYLSSRWLEIDPDFRNVQEHPRFRKLIRDHS